MISLHSYFAGEVLNSHFICFTVFQAYFNTTVLYHYFSTFSQLPRTKIFTSINYYQIKWFICLGIFLEYINYFRSRHQTITELLLVSEPSVFKKQRAKCVYLLKAQKLQAINSRNEVSEMFTRRRSEVQLFEILIWRIINRINRR